MIFDQLGPAPTKTDRFEFDNLDAFLTRATQTPKPLPRTPSIDSVFAASFGQFASFDETTDRARQGWPEGLARLQSVAALADMPQGIASLIPSPVFAEEGDEVAVDRYLDNEADCWVSFPTVPTPARGRVVSVIVHCGGNSQVSAEAWTNRGAAALSLIDALEQAGFRAEVTIATMSQTNERTFQFSCLLKRAEDPLELDRMAFFLMSSSVQRRFLFRLRETSAAPKHWIDRSMGYTQPIPDHFIPEGAIYFPAPAARLTEEQAKAQAAALLAQYFAAPSA
jgi:hypothetical protein